MLRVATVVGCNYPGTADALRGCINDAFLMRQMLVETFGFEERNITLLIDDDGGDQDDDDPDFVTEPPTGANIIRALHGMVRRAVDEMRRGRRSHLCFYFSGHGTLLHGHEAIVPCDHNLITDVDFRRLVDQVPPSARFAMVSDSCHSGGLIGHETEQIGPGARRARGAGAGAGGRTRFLAYETVLQRLGAAPRGLHQLGRHMVARFGDDASALFREPRAPVPVPRADSGILLSACQSDELARERDGYGAFTRALSRSLGALDEWPPWNHWIVVTAARERLKEKGFTQHPCLYCNDDNVGKSFLDRGI